jgi:hypothetical protein
MACSTRDETADVASALEKVNMGRLVVYRRALDLVQNVPAGRILLAILATREAPAALSETLQWLRRRWPRCPIAVVGDEGAGPHEMAARSGGALFLTRPVPAAHWQAILSHVLMSLPEGEARGAEQAVPRRGPRATEESAPTAGSSDRAARRSESLTRRTSQNGRRGARR